MDWSGDRRAPQKRIWVAEARAGELVALTGGLDREGAVAHVAAAGPVVAGFDFSFSFPAWWVRALGCRDVEELWARVAADGEAWLAACAPPLWGRPGRPRPARGAEEPELRATEAALGAAGPRPKSTFQVGGAGAVGTGAIRGMPLLPGLRRAGVAVWPWDDAGARTALEIYPRALTGPVVKSRAEAREAHLAGDPRVPPRLLAAATASEDAFDAAVSALVMAEHLPELLALRATRDPIARLEGAIWTPGATAA